MKTTNVIKDNVTSLLFHELRVRLVCVFFCLLFTVHCPLLYAQTHTVDSLLTRLKTDKADTTRVTHLTGLAWAYRNTGEVRKAMDLTDSAMGLAEKLNFKRGLSSSYNIRASIYYAEGDYPNTLSFLLKANEIDEALNDKSRVASNTGKMGLIYKQQGEYKKALECFTKALTTLEALNEKDGMATVMDNMGTDLELMHDTTSALEYYLKALAIYKELNNKDGLALTISNLANIYVDLRDYTKALQYYQDGIKLYEELDKKSGITTNYGNIGYTYLVQKKYKEAEPYLLKALDMAKSINDLERVKMNEDNLGDLYAATGQWEKALDARKKCNNAKDSLINQAKSKQIGKLEAKAQYDKDLALQKAEEDKKAALAAAESKRQKVFILFVAAIAIAIAVIAFIISRSLRTARIQKTLIEVQTEEVEKQKTVVEGKNQEILDSINYAKRLQEAILPPPEHIKNFFPDSFIIYKPKDIVSGDFYWLASPPSKGEINIPNSEISPLGSSGAVFLAAADCTGHGVPGALVSVVCSNALNRAVKEFGITDPGKILDKVRELVLETFEKSPGDVQDGMDISLCSIRASLPSKGGLNTASSGISPLGSGGVIEIQWAGAYNPLWYIQNGEIKEIVADKQPIGKTDKPKPFTTHTITLNPPKADGEATTFYFFTDGYADQFGGPKGKKFKYKQLQEKLLVNSNMSMAEQGKILEKTFETWMGFLDQVDDILIIGIRV